MSATLSMAPEVVKRALCVLTGYLRVADEWSGSSERVRSRKIANGCKRLALLYRTQGIVAHDRRLNGRGAC